MTICQSPVFSGREQASLTGKRLRALNLPFKLLVQSTMKRALETAELIMKELPTNELEVRSSDLLREGAPIPPEPPVGHWRPEKHVSRRSSSLLFSCFVACVCVAFCRQVDALPFFCPGCSLTLDHVAVLRGWSQDRGGLSQVLPPC